jgi:hypothetical protein
MRADPELSRELLREPKLTKPGLVLAIGHSQGLVCSTLVGISKRSYQVWRENPSPAMAQEMLVAIS